MHQPGHPGYVEMLDHGMTAMWEGWLSYKGSQSHPALGGVGDWFFSDLAGIRPDPEHPGFENVIFQPDLLGGLEYARAEYDTVRGLVRSAWTRKDERIILDVSIPPGATGQVRLPDVPGLEVEAPAEAKACGTSGASSGSRQWNLPSGAYRFLAHLPSE
jgi:alpha-L-rhamnosidase